MGKRSGSESPMQSILITGATSGIGRATTAKHAAGDRAVSLFRHDPVIFTIAEPHSGHRRRWRKNVGTGRLRLPALIASCVRYRGGGCSFTFSCYLAHLVHFVGATSDRHGLLPITATGCRHQPCFAPNNKLTSALLSMARKGVVAGF